jgi:hypothetical protein
MKYAVPIAVVLSLGLVTPVYACLSVTPAVRTWAQCGYKVASKTGDHKFMVNFARAKWLNEKLLPNAQGRWNKIEPRIVAACGSFTRAAALDRKNFDKIQKTMSGSFYVPDDKFEAIGDTSDIEKLVKTNA